MTKLKRYVYGRLFWRLLIPALVYAAICEAASPVRKSARSFLGPVVLVYALICLFVLVRGMEDVRAVCKKENTTYADICRDFILAESCGPFAVGKTYLFLWKGGKMYVIPIHEIKRTYRQRATYTTQYVTRGGYVTHEQKREKVAVIVETKHGRPIQIPSTTKKSDQFFLKLALRHPEIQIGYTDDES